MAADTLSRAFSALADPTRRNIVARLAEGDATVGQLAEPYQMTLQAVMSPDCALVAANRAIFDDLGVWLR